MSKERIFSTNHGGEIRFRVFPNEVVITCDHTKESICIPIYNFEQMIDYYRKSVATKKDTVE